MKFRPLNDRLLVQCLDSEEKTKGGIIIPDSAKEKPVQGKVVAAGPGKMLESGTVRALDVKEGQTVFFRKYSGTDVTVDNVAYLILREDDVLAVLQ